MGVPAGRTVAANWPSADVPTPSVDAERLLWVFVVAVMALDVLTTWVGLQVGLQEGNALVQHALDAYGIAGLVGIKGLVLVLAATVASVVPARMSPVVPLGLAIPTTVAVATNIVLVSTL